MTRYKNIILLANFILLAGYFSWSTIQKERTLKNGQLVLLQLAPVDPRSLMQGDYMVLRYAITGNSKHDIPKTGYYVLQLDGNSVGTVKRTQVKMQPAHDNEVIIRYKLWGDKIGAESYFFEEGKAGIFENAKYGGLKVDKNGATILTGLYDEDFNLIK
jgi:uncharacterized membrane-anchored protein